MIKMKRNKIHNLTSLLAEKQRLQEMTMIQENKMVDVTVYFKKNYKTIIWQKINPFKEGKTQNALLNLLFNEVFPAIINSENETGKLFSGGIKYAILKAGSGLINKMSKRKKNKKKEKKVED